MWRPTVYMVERKGGGATVKDVWELFWLVLMLMMIRRFTEMKKDTCKLQALGFCHNFFKCINGNKTNNNVPTINLHN